MVECRRVEDAPELAVVAHSMPIFRNARRTNNLSWLEVRKDLHLHLRGQVEEIELSTRLSLDLVRNRS